ncbi:putative oxidoreductase [Lachnellula cervina]|uniref:Putative oxidoreductase n=1 Tax=Lachnellula cervina TaxID=1316786 RepID=A0A7D8YZF0_9HELO|nr:putative oxidoreductase [Lachnellula cervina]
MPSYLITRARRGLGLGFANELLKKKESTVIATAINTAGSPGLQKLKKEHPDGRLILLNLDVMSADSIKATAEATNKLLPRGLDNLISNAGVNYNGLKTFDELIIEDLQKEISFNTTSQLLLLRAFVPLVRKSQGKKILVITSGLGSTQNAPNTPNLANGYSVAKATLNIRTSIGLYGSIALSSRMKALPPRSSTQVSWVGSTAIGDGISDWINTYAPDYKNLSLETSSANCMKVLDTLTPEANGEFFNHNGTKLPF